nr:hypothetical protein [Microbacterium bovistercoris]
MLHLIDHPALASRPVPWMVDRLYDTHPVVTNVSAEPLDFVRVLITGGRRAPGMTHWGQMLPGESAELCLCEHELDRTLVTLTWFQPGGGDELIWHFRA